MRCDTGLRAQTGAELKILGVVPMFGVRMIVVPDRVRLVGGLTEEPLLAGNLKADEAFDLPAVRGQLRFNITAHTTLSL